MNASGTVFTRRHVTVVNIKPILREQVETGTNRRTDSLHLMHDEFPHHDVVTHKRRNVRDTRMVAISLPTQRKATSVS